MKSIVSLSLILLNISFIFAQKMINKDLDFDGISDRVYVDSIEQKIVCELSTQNFIPNKSKSLGEVNDQSGVIISKDGFSFIVNWMRAGNTNQFRYNKTTQKIQLIGMSRYEFGNAANDGAGESSINLLTSNYIGNWNFYDYLANNEEGESVKIPTIKKKVKMETINLEDFGEETHIDYSGICASLFQKEKNEILKARGRKSLE